MFLNKYCLASNISIVRRVLNFVENAAKQLSKGMTSQFGVNCTQCICAEKKQKQRMEIGANDVTRVISDINAAE